MCYFFSLAEEEIRLQKRFDAKLDTRKQYLPQDKFIGFSYPSVPILTNDEPFILQYVNWGLVPSWVKSPEEVESIRKLTLNARAETIFEKPSFSGSIKYKRCLVPATGFYEWQHRGKQKIPYLIKMSKQNVFTFGGVWSEYIDFTTGELIKTFSIITVPANQLMSEIHNTKKRMPLIFTQESERQWLNNSLTKPDIQELMQPLLDGLLQAEIM